VDCSTLASLQTLTEIPGFGLPLYPFQLKGVHRIDRQDGRLIVSDEQGLGKTAQAAAYIQLRREKTLPALVICPASVKYHWRNKLTEWVPNVRIHVVEGAPKAGECLPAADVYVANYDILSASGKCPTCNGTKTDPKNLAKCRSCKGTGKTVRMREGLRRVGLKLVVADECHYLKDAKSQRTRAFFDLVTGEGAPQRILPMSGTPIKNRPVEWYGLLHLIAPETFPTWFGYVTEFCDGKQGQWGWEVDGASNLERLHALVSRVMIRRTKDEVLRELPPKVRTVVPLNDLEGLPQYRKVEAAFAAWIRDLKARAKKGEREAVKELSAAALVKIEALKQEAVRAKLGSVVGWVRDYLETEDKLVVFAHHKEVIDRLAEELAEFRPVRVDGGTKGEARQASVDRFQSDPSCRVFLGSQAAKEGITLTAAHATCFVELWWTPGDHSQAEDRVHRIGQEHDSVSAYYLIAVGTIEEQIAELLDRKRMVLDAALDGRETEDVNLLGALLDGFQA
jgi:SWI/SNF-related matrix-associated actin-dependent regulator 1 of chromatin subfamily A